MTDSNGLATADICDRHEAALTDGRLRILTCPLRGFGGRKSFCGIASTLRVFEDNSLVRKALDQPGAGRVLVVDGGGSLRRALLGDQLALLAAKNGWAGIVVYGCIRDSAAIAAIAIGVLALGTHPRKTEKKDAGEADVPVSFGGTDIRPGDWIYADEDGTLVSDCALT